MTITITREGSDEPITIDETFKTLRALDQELYDTLKKAVQLELAISRLMQKMYMNYEIAPAHKGD